MKVLDSYWFNGGGIVRVLDSENIIRYYIKGLDNMTTAEYDAQQIADWGNTFPTKVGDALFGINQ